MTKAQQIYDKVEALVATGTPKAEAFRQVATEFDQPFNSMRGAYYAHSRSLSGGSTRPRKRETTTADAVQSATQVLRRALDAIDGEVLAAKARADEAKAEHEAMKNSAGERKEALTAKITALES